MRNAPARTVPASAIADIERASLMSTGTANVIAHENSNLQHETLDARPRLARWT